MTTRLYYDRDVYVVVGRSGETGREIRGLKIDFDVTKDDTSAPNRAKLTIFNLSEDTAALFDQDDAVVQIFGGYQDQADLLFLGDVTRAVTTVEGPDSKTAVESGDGQKALSTGRSRVALKGKTTVKQVLVDTLKDVVKDPVKALTGAPPDVTDKVLPRGFSASGSTKTVLRGLARARGFDWFYLDGQLRIVGRDQSLQEPAVLLNPDTGLIGTPARLKGKGSAGIQIRSVLNGRIRPRRIVRVESSTFEGFYLVRKVTHRGDNGWSSNPAVTILEATELEP